MIKSDVLIIGSGVAGLTLAIKIAEKRSDLKITVLSKNNLEEGNTKYAQGGVAAVWNKDTDNYEKHIADTLDAGAGLCNEEIVEIVVTEGPKRVKELIKWGTRFDKNKEQEYDLGKEGGHSENRILHYKDITGAEIQRAIIEKAKSYDNIRTLEHYYAIHLITQHQLGHVITRVTPDIECYGVYALNRKNGDIKTFLAKKTILATGGAGQIYRSTTNPIVASGDGIAMVYRAKGRVENMEFVQFHPTALYNPTKDNPVFLVSEAVRGFGGILKDAAGVEFMYAYDKRGSLAPRDIVARAIDNEMKVRGVEFMYLDCRHLDMEKFIAHFPNIYEKCMSIGIDVAVQMVPIVPACHYMCGGIKVDPKGKSSIKDLYACGESTSTGLHGANRLASNSLLEAVVFAHRIAKDVVKHIDECEIIKGIPEWKVDGTTDPSELVLITQSIKEIKEIMSSYVGIVRSNRRLKRAHDRVNLIYRETEALYASTSISPQLCELRNLITIAYLVTKSAYMRMESRGLHYTTDFPNKYNFLETVIL